MNKTELTESISFKTQDEISWAAQPRQGLFFTTQDFFLLPFSMFGCGFGYFFTLMPELIKAPDSIAYFGYAIIIISLYFSIFRFIIDAMLRSKTYYALSKNYAYIVVSGKISRIELSKIKHLSYDTAPDGSGSIWLSKQSTLQLFLGNSLNGLPFHRHPNAFLYINEVKIAVQKLKNSQKET